MTEEAQSSLDQSTWLIIAVVVISVSGMLCCGCLAIAWILGDAVVQIVEQLSNFIGFLPL